jgi:hypothetical protein
MIVSSIIIVLRCSLSKSPCAFLVCLSPLLHPCLARIARLILRINCVVLITHTTTAVVAQRRKSLKRRRLRSKSSNPLMQPSLRVYCARSIFPTMRRSSKLSWCVDALLSIFYISSLEYIPSFCYYCSQVAFSAFAPLLRCSRFS